MTVTTTEVYEACESVRAGDLLSAGPFVVGTGGDVVLHGGDEVVIENGFEVETDALLELRSDLE